MTEIPHPSRRGGGPPPKRGAVLSCVTGTCGWASVSRLRWTSSSSNPCRQPIERQDGLQQARLAHACARHHDHLHTGVFAVRALTAASVAFASSASATRFTFTLRMPLPRRPRSTPSEAHSHSAPPPATHTCGSESSGRRRSTPPHTTGTAAGTRPTPARAARPSHKVPRAVNSNANASA